ncbi:MAG: DsbA family protein [Longimicrobiales bacterium]
MTTRAMFVPIALLCACFAPVHAQDPLDGAGYVEGRPDAPIQIIEFADYSCPFCAKFSRETMPAFRRDWIETGRASIRFIGFHNSYYEPGRDAARAAECAADQDAFWAMHDLIFERQRGWLSRGGQRERFEEWAEELGLDMPAFRLCWKEDPGKDRLEHNTKLARERGVRATPTFFIGGKKIEGALTYEQLRALLEQENARLTAIEPGCWNCSTCYPVASAWRLVARAPWRVGVNL